MCDLLHAAVAEYVGPPRIWSPFIWCRRIRVVYGRAGDLPNIPDLILGTEVRVALPAVSFERLLKFRAAGPEEVWEAGFSFRRLKLLG